MKCTHVLLALGCLLSIAGAQWCETTIPVPESLLGMMDPGCLVYDSVNNTIYVGGGSNVIAIDGGTNQKIARIPTGSGVSAVCYNPQNNKVYCASLNDAAPDSGSVTIIDAATNSVIATLADIGKDPCALCYNPQNNKVYCANYWGRNVTVVDGATDQVIATVTAGEHPCALCYNPQNNKVYCANQNSDNVTVIDGVTNQVIANVTEGFRPQALCYNPQNNKVYSASYISNKVTVFDGATNGVITTVGVGLGPRALCYNPHDNKVYCANSGLAFEDRGSVTVIDGSTNAVITTVTAGAYPLALCYSAQSNKVYCANEGKLSFHAGSVTVIDGTTNGVVATVTAGSGQRALCCNPQANKVYCAVCDWSYVAVIDGATSQVLTTVLTGDQPYALGYNPQNNKIYCANYVSGSVTIVDGATNSIITTAVIRAEASSRAFCYNPQNNKVYCGNRNSVYVTVIDGATDQIIDSVGVGGGNGALCYNSQNNKVYSVLRNSVTVFDGATNQTIVGIRVDGAQALCYNPRNNKVYCSSSANLTVISGATDSVVATINGWGNALCYNPQNNKVYCSNGLVIDGATDQVVDTIRGGGDFWSFGTFCYNVQNNRVYGRSLDSVAVIDCNTDSVIAAIDLGFGDGALCYDPQNNKVYCANPYFASTVTVIAGANNKVRKSLVVGADPCAFELNPVQNRIYVANKAGSSVTVLRDHVGPPLGDLDVDPDSLDVVADTIRLQGPHSSALETVARTLPMDHMPASSLAMPNHTLAFLPRQSAPVKTGVSAVAAPLSSVGRSSATGSGPCSDYAVGEFILANTSASYNPNSTDGPSQSPVDSLNLTGSLVGPGGTLDSILIRSLPESLAQGRAIVCTLAVYMPPGLKHGKYAGSITISGRDTAGIAVLESFNVLMRNGKLGDLDVDNDSLDVVSDTIRVQPSPVASELTARPSVRAGLSTAPSSLPVQSSGPARISAGQPVQSRLCTVSRAPTGYELGAFILANTSASYNPDPIDGPSISPVDSLSFTGSLTGPGGTIDSILIQNLPGSLAQGQSVTCTLAVYVPDSLPGGDYSGPIVIAGLDSLHSEIAETVYALVKKGAGVEELGDLDVDSDSLDVVHDTMNLHTQPAGPVYYPYAKARFTLVNSSESYNPDAEDGPSRSTLREVKVEAKVEGQNGSIDSVYVLNLPESLAVGQAVECTLAVVLPVGATADDYSGWVTISAVDTLGYQVRDSFAIAVRGPQPRQNLDSLRVAPIPFKPNQNPEHDAIHFQGLTAGARVIVYDASGQEVWRATESGDGHLKWDAKVASGIYVYLVVSADGKTSKVGKLSVIR